MADKITIRRVDALAAGAVIWDGELRGFGVRRRGDADPVYFIQCRIGIGRGSPQRWLSIGKHGSPWTPETARARAETMLRDARSGVDPLRALEAAKTSPTISKLCDAYLEAAPTYVSPRKGRPKKQRSIDTDRSNIDSHIRPLLGKRRADDLRRQDVERFQRDVAAGKTKRRAKTKPRGISNVRGGEGIAARATAVLRAIFSWGIREGLVKENPASGVALFKGKPIERFLSAEELARLGAVLDAAEAEWRDWESRCARAIAAGEPQPLRAGENPIAIAALRLLILTGARKMEILGLQWPWVDLARGMIRLPDSKTGAKTIRLGAPALKVLQSLPRLAKNPHVFVGDKEGAHLVGLPHIWTRLKKRAGLPDVRIHDLRHSFASSAVMAGDSLYLVGKMLGHANTATTEKYAHLADDPLHAAIDRNARRIEEAMNRKGENSRPPLPVPTFES
jgi:integrase